MLCKQTVVTIWTKGTANSIKWMGTTVAEKGPTVMLHPIHVRWTTCHKSVDRSWCTRPWIHGGTRVWKAGFQGAASPCSRWPIASFTLPGLTHPVRLHPVYLWILGLSRPVLPLLVTNLSCHGPLARSEKLPSAAVVYVLDQSLIFFFFGLTDTHAASTICLVAVEVKPRLSAVFTAADKHFTKSQTAQTWRFP